MVMRVTQLQLLLCSFFNSCNLLLSSLPPLVPITPQAMAVILRRSMDKLRDSGANGPSSFSPSVGMIRRPVAMLLKVKGEILTGREQPPKRAIVSETAQDARRSLEACL